MLPFLRSDLAQLVSYTPHPGGSADHPALPLHDPVDRLDTNECPYDLPEDLKQKLAWEYQHAIASNRYPDGGHERLKEAIAQYINESTPSTWVDTTHLSVGNGSDELIRSLLIATCLGGTGSILVADPTFSMYAITAQTLGIPVVAVGRSESNFEVDLQAARAAVEQTQNPPIRVVFVVHPNSPTGNSLTESELDWLRSMPQHILVVIDEAYFEFSGKTVVNELPQHPNWIVLRTFSKAFRLAAHRVGYAIAQPELAATLEKVRLPYNLPSVSLAAARLAMSHRTLLLQAIPQLLLEREQLFQSLQKISVSEIDKTQSSASFNKLQIWPSDANFLFVRLLLERGTSPSTYSDEALDYIFQTLKSKGTLIRKTCGGLRITVGTPQENQRTLERLSSLLPSALQL